jgi:GntR family transcriptional regulator/MocR family aminotransferase
MVLPPPLIEPVIAAKRTADLQTGTLDQLTLAEFIASGHYDRHVRRCRLQGLALTALDHYRFRPDPFARQALVVGYGTPPDHSYTGALDLLCQVLGV